MQNVNVVQNIKTFDDVYEITKNMTNKEKGDLFELITLYLFKLSPILNNNLENIWMYNDIPTLIKKNLSLPDKDKGIDLLLKRNGEYYAIQSKFRQDFDKCITWNELSTFFGLSFGLNNKIKGGYFVTNTYDMCNEVDISTKISSINGNFFDESLPENFFKNMYLMHYENKKISPYIKRIPHLFQKECITKCKEHFNTIIKEHIGGLIDDESDDPEYEKSEDSDCDLDNDDVIEIEKIDPSKGHFEMCCGSGKSLTAYWVDKELKHILTVVFVPSLYLLSQFYADWVNQSHAENININYLLVGSDADVDDDVKSKGNINGLVLHTDPIEIRNYINKIIESNKKLVVISTYQSSNKLAEACNKEISFDFGIFDEAHKTVGQVGKQFTLMLNDDKLKINKRLFMTATLKIYGGKMDEDDEDIISMNNEKYYGKQIFCYNTGNGINDKYLCDYQLVTIIATNNDVEQLITKNKLVKYKESFSDEESNYLGTILMLLKKMYDGTSNHMITYHNTVKRAKKFCKFLKIINDMMYKDNDIYFDSFDGSTLMSNRKKIIKEFKKQKKSILCTAKVLNEGVNIPIIDSVCFVDVRNSTVDIVQCVGRALRLYEGKNIAHVYVPTFIEDINDDIFEDNKIFGNTIRVLKSMKSTDGGITEYFTLKSEGKQITGRKICVVERITSMTISEEIKFNEWVEQVGVKIWKIVDPFLSKYAVLKEWVDINKKIPSHEAKNEKEKGLGIFCNKMRNKKKKKILDKNKIDLLECINGWFWTKVRPFDNVYNELIKWKQLNGRLPKLSKKDKEENFLCQWCSSRKKEKNINKLSDEKIEMLQQIEGWKWERKVIPKTYEETYKDVKEWIQINNKIPSPKSINRVEKQLGDWCSVRRQDKKNGKLSDDKIKMLELLLFWYWGSAKIKRAVVKPFDEIYKEVKKWIDDNGKLPMSNRNSEKEKQLSYWCGRQRKAKNKNKLSDDKIKMLNQLKFWHWSKDDIQIDELADDRIDKQTDEQNDKEINEQVDKQAIVLQANIQAALQQAIQKALQAAAHANVQIDVQAIVNTAMQANVQDINMHNNNNNDKLKEQKLRKTVIVRGKKTDDNKEEIINVAIINVQTSNVQTSSIPKLRKTVIVKGKKVKDIKEETNNI